MPKTNHTNAQPFERFLSATVDGVIHIGLLLFAVYFVSTSANRNMLLDNLLNAAIYLMMLWLIFSLIQITLTTYVGGSIGKILGGLQVLSRKSNKLISFPRSVFRHLVKFTLSAKVLWLGYFWILIHKERLSWHDMAADTKVVSTTRAGWIVSILVLIILISGIGVMVTMSVQGFVHNSNVYTNMFLDLKNSF